MGDKTTSELNQIISALQELPIERERIRAQEDNLQDFYQVGDEVYIDNHIRHVHRRAAERNDRVARVIRIKEPDKVHIRTANGFVTWRKPKYLRPLNEVQYS